MNRIAILTIISLILTFAIAAPAQAVYFMADEYGSTENTGVFAADVYYEAHSSTEATLTVTLWNYTPEYLGGYITGFALNNPGDKISTVEAGEYFDEDFQVMGEDSPYNAVKATPFGLFDFGASLKGKFLGSGKPQGGLASDSGMEMHLFQFQLTGDEMDTITDSDFMYEASKRKGSPQVGSFAVRFRGFADGGSDKTLGIPAWGGGE